MRFDVAVVGGGPAGARAAWRLTRAGAHVAIFDGSHPREKPCGGGVTGRALQVVEDQLGGAPLDGIVITRARFEYEGNRASVDLPHDGIAPASALIVVGRAMFDAALLSSAIAAGAHHVAAPVRDLERSTNGWTIGAGGRRFEARILIGADGANSFVRRRVWRPFERAQLSIATGYFARGATSDGIVVEFEREPAGYLWSFPRRDHLAIGVCAQADGSTPAALRAIADRWIAREGIAAPLDDYSWPIPSLSADDLARDRASGDGWLLVGDAAGFVDPITREGIFFALQSADFAVDAILAGRNIDTAYRRMVADVIAPELGRAAALKSGFFRPRFVRLLIHALQTSAPVRHIMADLVAGRQSYRTLARRLLGTLDVGLAWRLLRLRLAG